MKYLTTLILAVLYFQFSYSQKADTVRVYDYLKPGDSWKLKVKGNNTFKLYTNILFGTDVVTTTGTCNIGDSTIQFICDSSGLKNKNNTLKSFRHLSNFMFSFCGKTYGKRNSFFLPPNINYASEDSARMPEGIYARYYRGDGFGSNVIEIKDDGTYIFYDNSCMANSKEKGKWSLRNDVLTFRPTDKKWSRLEWVTDNRKLYLTEGHLVGKKVAKTVTQIKKPVVTETFYFLSKEPDEGDE